MPYTPPPPGTPTTPGWWSRAWEAILARTRIVAGPGLRTVAMPDGGTVISLDGGREMRFYARVTAAPAFEPTAPGACLYSAEAYARPGLTLTNVLPRLGRPTQNDEWMLWPARVGDDCTIVRRRTPTGDTEDVLWIKTEAIAARPCG